MTLALYLLFSTMYSAAVVVRFAPVGLSVTAALIIVLACLARSRYGARDNTVPIVLAATAWSLVGMFWLDISSAGLRYMVLFPIATLTGYLLNLYGFTKTALKAFLHVSIVVAVLAITEHIVGRSLIGDTSRFEFFARMRTFRSAVATDHPLVLAIFLTAAIVAIAAFNFELWQRMTIFAVLAFGVFATDGRVSLAFSLVCGTAIVLLSVRFRSLLTRARFIALSLSLISWTFIGYLAAFEWTNAAYGETAADSSAAYRPAIYSFLPKILSENPLGIGFADIPRGIWLVQGRSIVYDLGNTVDSELVLLTLRFGYIGLFLYAAIWLLFVLSLKHSPVVGLMGLVVIMLGLSTALSAWNTLGGALFLLLGLASGSLRHRAAPIDSGQLESPNQLQ